jgi:hypothetical protein
MPETKMMQRKFKTLAFLIAVVLPFSYRTSFAQEGQIHWLIGRWDGLLEESSRKGGRNRTLRVLDVTPDNSGPATFGRSPLDSTRAELNLEGAKVKVVTLTTKRVVELTRQGDESLVGTFTDESGQKFPIRLTKIKLSSEFDGRWEGEGLTRPGCMLPATDFYQDSNYYLTIQNGLITGYSLARVHHPLTGSKFRKSTVTGQVEPDGIGVLVQTPLSQGGASGNLVGTFTGTEFHASQTRGRCAYDVKLMRK